MMRRSGNSAEAERGGSQRGGRACRPMTSREYAPQHKHRRALVARTAQTLGTPNCIALHHTGRGQPLLLITTTFTRDYYALKMKHFLLFSEPLIEHLIATQ